MKNTDFRWSKRDGPLWAVHIKKKDRKTERQTKRQKKVTESETERKISIQRDRTTERQAVHI